MTEKELLTITSGDFIIFEGTPIVGKSRISEEFERLIAVDKRVKREEKLKYLLENTKPF